MKRRSMLGLAALCFGLVAISAAPAEAAPKRQSGLWKIDPTRSSFSDGTFPANMSFTLTMTITDDRIVYGSVNDTFKERPPSLTNFETSLDGKPSPFANQTRFNQISVLRLNPNEYRIMKMKDDDVIVGEYWTFLRDRKTLVRRGVGKNAQGKSRAFEETFVRVGDAPKSPAP